MDTIQKARQVILDAEASLRELISTALENQRYGDVKEIADLADRLARLITSNDIQLSATKQKKPVKHSAPNFLLSKSEPEPEPQNLALPPTRRSSHKAKTASKTKANYPKFVKDEDRLVKIGWSKKNKAEYEHRVPREAVLGFLRHLDHMVEPEKLFEIESILPVQDTSGEDIPGYQVYVVVAWLRMTGVIEKRGRDGYLIRDKSVLGETNDIWNSLQPRSV